MFTFHFHLSIKRIDFNRQCLETLRSFQLIKQLEKIYYKLTTKVNNRKTLRMYLTFDLNLCTQTRLTRYIFIYLLAASANIFPTYISFFVDCNLINTKYLRYKNNKKKNMKLLQTVIDNLSNGINFYFFSFCCCCSCHHHRYIEKKSIFKHPKRKVQ